MDGTLVNTDLFCCHICALVMSWYDSKETYLRNFLFLSKEGGLIFCSYGFTLQYYLLKSLDVYQVFGKIVFYCKIKNCLEISAKVRGASSSWNCLPRGMSKMRNHYFYSSGNEETGNKLISFLGEWGINLSSSRIPKIPQNF